MPTKDKIENRRGKVVAKITERTMINEDEDFGLKISRNNLEEKLVFEVEDNEENWEIDLDDVGILIETIAELAELEVTIK